MCILPLCISAASVCIASGGMKKESDSLNIQTVVAIMWVLGTEPRSSARVAGALIH